MASHHRTPHIAACLFAGFQIGFSCAAHIVARPIHLGQQGRLQRRSLFLVLLRRERAVADKGETYDSTSTVVGTVGAAQLRAPKIKPDLDSRVMSLQTE
jgi:hypothetical protein